jgi:hypothetical protein
MSSVTADSFGDFVPDHRSPPSNDQVAVRQKPPEVQQRALIQRTPNYGQEPDIGKWPVWKVSVFVVVFCGAFWAGVIYLGMRLFS